MATEYIKKKDALNAFRRVYMVPLESKAKDIYSQQIENTYRKIESIPAVDVVPRELYELALSDVVTLSVERKHGKWEDVEVTDISGRTDLPLPSISSMRCSVCNRYHNEVYHYGIPTEMAHFCPNCGARMVSE